jgi:nucleotide-binding universal stress UspA family protein
MATHGRSGLSRLLMGSVAADVLRRAPVPVLLFKAGERAG